MNSVSGPTLLYETDNYIVFFVGRSGRTHGRRRFRFEAELSDTDRLEEQSRYDCPAPCVTPRTIRRPPELQPGLDQRPDQQPSFGGRCSLDVFFLEPEPNTRR